MNDTKVIFKLKKIKDSDGLKKTLKRQTGVNAVEIAAGEPKVFAQIDSDQVELQTLNDVFSKLGYHPQRITIAEI